MPVKRGRWRNRSWSRSGRGGSGSAGTAAVSNFAGRRGDYNHKENCAQKTVSRILRCACARVRRDSARQDRFYWRNATGEQTGDGGMLGLGSFDKLFRTLGVARLITLWFSCCAGLWSICGSGRPVRFRHSKSPNKGVVQLTGSRGEHLVTELLSVLETVRAMSCSASELRCDCV